MSFKSLRECSVCEGKGYKVMKGDEVNPSDNPDHLRWVQVRCKRCKGMGYLRE
jgi:DnaJ-class molecular chaperone